MDVDQGCGYIDFEEAYHLYSSFGQFFCPDKQAFRDKLLDEIHGFLSMSLLNLLRARSLSL